MAAINKGITVLFLLVLVLGVAPESAEDLAERRVGRVGKTFLSFLGYGNKIRCNGCPSHFCDDDPAIIHGYCCGCADTFESLPIRCRGSLDCPHNLRSLCHDYEYMMQCCCNS